MRLRVVRAAVLAAAGVCGAGVLQAQSPTSQDKDFLKNTAEDSHYEIKTAQLALTKSNSADVKAYAQMLIQDHTALDRQVRQADASLQVEAVKPGSMSLTDSASYAKLKLLSGKTFEDSYIKSLNSGNDEAVNTAKSEAAGTAVPAIKQIAMRRAALDTKHAEKAKALAQAHGVDGK